MVSAQALGSFGSVGKHFNQHDFLWVGVVCGVLCYSRVGVGMGWFGRLGERVVEAQHMCPYCISWRMARLGRRLTIAMLC